VPRILIIDDDALLARSVGRMLAMFDVAIETDPRSAVRRIEAGERFDIVICDLNMPALSGYQVLATIRARLEPPDVIMTSGGDDLLELGAVADASVLLKPFRATELRTLVASLLDARRALQVELVGEELDHAIDRDSVLRSGIAIANRDGLVL
jgi:CheY-like chemotaxis protein